MGNSKYYFFYLEIALKKKDDLNIYAFENVSHIPTSKLIEIFNINLEKDPYLMEGYFLTKTSYRKHKKYVSAHIGQINLDVFEYCLRQYVADDFKEIRKLYKESLME
jgi:hypothetical protein